MKNLSLVASRPGSASFNTYEDLRARAKRRVPRMIFDFVDGGADGEVTTRANRSSWDDLRFDPRYLRDVSERQITTTVLGHPIAVPFVLAPAGLATVVHPEGELAAARAAGRAGTIFVMSTASGYSIESIMSVATGPVWFQLYLWKDDSVVDQMVDRAAQTGCSALVLTIDVPLVGKRERDLRNGMSLPPRVRPSGALDAARRVRWLKGLLTGPEITFANLAGVAEGDSATTVGQYVDRELVDPTATWERVDRLRERWEGPLVVKGVMSADDAATAVAHGADAVYVSNHGGRQLDGALGTSEVLSEVVAAVDGKAEVYIDGGIRRGADIVKAKALGATAAFGGRPWVFGLAADGERGVDRMLEIFSTDVDRTLALIGRPRFDDVDASALRRDLPGRR
jgi:isopentenyl diphosphate isomerase/L-lactate dehydrogenase-like FMN-dependent dehydrogenase